MRLSQRRSQIDSSGIRKVFDLAASMKDPINLSIGLPDFDVPDLVKESAIDAIRAGKNRYTQTGGTPVLRQAVRALYEKRGVPFDDVMIASGTSGALFLVLLATVDPGDEVLIPDPYFVMYEALVKFLGAVPVLVDTYPDFRITAEALAKVTTPRTKMLILNSPSNPTGTVYTEADAKAAVEFAEARGIIILSDEIYEPFCFDAEFVSPAKYARNPIIISGLSKTVAMTGWRLGWVVGPSDLIKAITEIQQYTFVCAPSIAQEAALEGLKHDMRPANDDYRKRRDFIYNGLVNAGYRTPKPGGAFYIFPEAPNGDGGVFVSEAIKRNLLIVPGSVFSARNTNFRISFAASPEKLAAGLRVLEDLQKHFARNSG